MFHRIADGARRVLFLAQREARGLGSEMMGSEHILLGLIAEGEGVAAKALDSFHISLAAARAKVDEVTAAHGAQKTDLSRLPQGTDVPLTAGAKRLLERSGFEAFQRGHNYLDTEHLLFAILANDDDVATRVLVELGVDVTVAWERVMELLAVGSDTAP